MKVAVTSVLALAAAALAHAVPNNHLAKRDAQSVTLIFEAGPASYNLTIPADGQEYFTGTCPKFQSRTGPRGFSRLP